MKENRVIDFRFAPERPQSCIGLVDDIHKTILREDGSINFGFSRGRDADTLQFYMRNNDIRYPVHNRGFRFRYKPTIT